MSVAQVAGIFFDHADRSVFSLTTNKNNFNTLIKQWHKLVISG